MRLLPALDSDLCPGAGLARRSGPCTDTPTCHALESKMVAGLTGKGHLFPAPLATRPVGVGIGVVIGSVKHLRVERLQLWL